MIGRFLHNLFFTNGKADSFTAKFNVVAKVCLYAESQKRHCRKILTIEYCSLELWPARFFLSCLQPGFFCSSSCASLWDISMNLWVPTLLRYAKSPPLVKTLFCPCAGSNWSTKRSHGKASHIPQCSTRSFAQAYNLHLPQKGSPFWLPHPEQFGFSFLFRNLHVPQYVPQGGTSLPFIHSSLKYQQICVIIISLVWRALLERSCPTHLSHLLSWDLVEFHGSSYHLRNNPRVGCVGICSPPKRRRHPQLPFFLCTRAPFRFVQNLLSPVGENDNG